MALDRATYRGAPPSPRDEAREKYLLDKLAQVRKTCEWLAGLGIAAILGQILRSPPTDALLRRIPILLGSFQVASSLAGALAWPTKDVDVANLEIYLERTLRVRWTIQWIALLLLVVSLAFLLWTLW